MSKLIEDLSGKKFGKLTALNYYRDHKNIIKYNCVCDCGNTKSAVHSGHLKSGSVSSCGCIKFQDLIGKKFGKLIVLNHFINEKGNRVCICRCECGNIKEILSNSLKSKNTVSCGCYGISLLRKYRFKKHGKYRTEEYKVWSGMKQRCYNNQSESYPYYGGRGINICDKWLNSFENFIKDMGKRPGKNYSIERIDNNGNYEPGNCRWATIKEQGNNKRNNINIEYKGKIKTIGEWADEFGFNRDTLLQRFKKNNNFEEIIKTKTKKLNYFKILKFDLNEIFIKEYNTIVEAAKDSKTSVNTIRKSCKNNEVIGNFIWKYKK